MDAVPVISTSNALFERVQQLVGKKKNAGFNDAVLMQPATALDVLNMEMPELVFIDFSDKNFSAFSLMDGIMADPWIFHCGIIALYGDYAELERLDAIKGANIIVAIMDNELERHLPKIMDIVSGNRRILFQRELGVDLVWNISGSFKLKNDPLEASCYANLISNFLCNALRIGLEEKPVCTLAIFEMLMNAIEHGNCGINYGEKSQWLEAGKPIQDLIRQKCKDPTVDKKRVTFEYAFLPECARFFIADEGGGFDWRRFVDGIHKTGELELHGRGISIAKSLMRNLQYNETGTEVSFEIAYPKNVSAVTPALFKSISAKNVRPGQVIFRYGEPGDSMYYIVKGQYDVVVNGKTVSSLSADDVFLGEMSFLLNNRRSATVKARSAGTIIPISKNDFIEAVKRKPYYALFLSKLLAQRIQRFNQRAFNL
ncbi:MAG TPA: cyclic nucleotide-binding domain-containing protein [Chitinivibrionales bacterium]|nr:cyclic nucleotide-binding domain-containing protein [Chitinivibrionales bacterium]